MTEVHPRLSASLADRYRIERELGKGGMATVYLAADLKHDRKVAIKVLKPELAAVLGAERFVQEIKTTAALSHPHILPLFDSGEAGGFLYYVMPYIEGETIRERLNRETQFGIDEAVRITTEVADALDYAHRHGVIHRDIKPENILLHDGRAMVMDFGIALAVSAAAGGRMTETGLSLGTPHYMSPEQATADKQITARSDLYSLASVLYEMLAGERPQPVTELRTSVPPNVAAALGKALEKLPADRFESAAKFADALGNADFRDTRTGVRSVAAARPSWQRWAMLGLAGTGGAVLAIATFLFLRPQAAVDVVRFPLSMPAGQRMDVLWRDDAPFAISPDGKRIAYSAVDSVSGGRRLFVRTLDQLEGAPLPGTEDAVSPFFSPDGQWLGFFAGDEKVLRKVPLSGGPATTLARDTYREFASGSWSDDGYIYFTPRSGQLARVRESGGPVEQFKYEGIAWAGWPSALPGGRYVLAEACTDFNCTRADVAVFDVESSKAKVVVENARRGWYIGDDVLVYATLDGTVYAAPFDLSRLEVRGTPVAVQGDVSVASDGAWLTLSRSGTMMYQPGTSQAAAVQVVEVDRAGRERILTTAPGRFLHPRWAPTGDRIALTLDKELSRHIAVYDVRSKTMTQLTAEGDNWRPSWSPDGRRIAFVSTRADTEALYWQLADGSQPAERISTNGQTGGNSAWTRDGRWIVFDGAGGRSATGEDVFAVRTDSTRMVQPVAPTLGNDQVGAVSPDGQWLAYNSDEGGGRYQVYVRPFLKPGGRWLVSAGPAVSPMWTANNELAYQDMTTMQLIAARLELGVDVKVASRTPLFSWMPYLSGTPSYPNADVSWDGQRFLALRIPGASRQVAPPVVVLKWFVEVKRKVAAAQGGKAK